MYGGEPTTVLERTRVVESPVSRARTVAIPKSSTFVTVTPAACARNTFSGLRSRCTSPRACASSSTRQMSPTICITRDAGRWSLCVDLGAQRAALQALHDQEGASRRRDAHIVHDDDVGMREARRRLRLAAEVLRGVAASHEAVVDDLHRDGPIEVEIVRGVPVPMPPAPIRVSSRYRPASTGGISVAIRSAPSAGHLAVPVSRQAPQTGHSER